MRKLIMWNIVTLDGYFEGDKQWDLPFHEVVWGTELEQLSIKQLNAADYLVFGRVTYEGMAAHWKNETGEIADLMNEIPKLVFSGTLTAADWNNTTLITTDAAAEIAKRNEDRKRVVEGKSETVRVDLGGSRRMKTKNDTKTR